MKSWFTFLKSGLKVQFTSELDGNPDSFLWEFGDGVTSDEGNPEHTYGKIGFFQVSLTIVKADIPYKNTQLIGVNTDPSFLVLDTKLNDLIVSYLPDNMYIEDIPKEISRLTKKWQLFIQPLVNHELHINNVHNELYYAPLENYLIAQLVARELLLNAMHKFLLSSASQTGDNAPGQQLKAVKTGPAEAEWYNSSDFWKEVVKPGGSLELLTQSLCSLSHRLRVTFEFCRKLDHNTIPPQVYRKPKVVFTSPFDKSRL